MRSASGSGNPASISTWRRQLSTLDCSSSRHTVVSIVSATVLPRLFVLALTIPPPESWAAHKVLTSVEALGDLVPREHLHGAVELAVEARDRLLARRAEPLVELHHRELGVPLDLAFGHTCKALGLAPLPLDEHHVQPRADVRLALLDRLGDRRLARAEPLRGLLDRAPSLERLRLELVEGLAHGLARGPLELLAQAEDGLALLVRRRAELARLALEPRLDVRDRLLVLLLEPCELRLQVALGALEILGEAAQALLEAALAARELLCEPLARVPLAVLELDPPPLREPALLGAEHRGRLRPLAREHAADLLRVRRGLGRDRRTNRRARLIDERVRRGGRCTRAAERPPQ